ncbi:MAG: thiamine pyrophosphate-binding protein [Lachnospiraceae bacterium]|nr:thiamine pyrophosphate-binding protein [Lachnospiraceae bacterium]
MIKVSDYVTQFIVDHGVKDIFMISGGGMMHLLDSVQKQEGLNPVFNLNEQASGICAEAYGQYTGNLGVCMVTTGPGATNALTGCAGAWVAGTPSMFISGQVKTEQMGQLRGLRFYGLQEIAIVPCVKPITKYAVTILDKTEIQYHLQKAYYLATHGRKGPVWIDIPLDIQGALVDEGELKEYDPVAEGDVFEPDIKSEDVKSIYELLNESERPVVLIGNGVPAAGAQEEIRYLTEKFQIPVLATWRAKGIYGDDEEHYMGAPGIPTTRYSNFVLQNSDFLLIIGCRMNAAITVYDEGHFAPEAKKVIVDIESAEMDKLGINFEMKINADAGKFLEKMIDNEALYKQKNREKWLSYCKRVKEKYPLRLEKQPYDNEGKVDGFLLAETLSDYSKADDVFVGSDSGRTCGISHMAYRLKKGQKFVESLSLGSMGWCLPSAIACCIASKKRRTLLIEGDGSLQHNIQELKLIGTYKLPVKLFVYENSGYASIYTMQRNNFEGRYCGCDADSGLVLPDLRGVASLYNLKYRLISNNGMLDDTIREIMSDNEPCLCEVKGSIYFDEIPKSVTIVNDDGTFSSSKLENLYPFLTEEELKQNMPEWQD